MTFTAVAKDIKEFASKKIAYMRAYVELEAQYQDKIKEGMMGPKQAELKLQELRAEALAYSQNTSQKIMDEIEQERTKQLEVLEKEAQGVTADDVAELSLLAMTDNITKEEYESYLKKYQNKPLAVKKLRELAGKKPELLIIDIDKFDKKQGIENKAQFLRQQVANYDGRFQADGDVIQLSVAETMYQNGEIIDSFLNGSMAFNG